MRYCNLKFGYVYNKASVKSTAFQTVLVTKNTPKPNGTQNVPGKLYCDQTTPWQGVYFFTNTVKVGAE